MPSLGAGMEDGVLARWRCRPGDQVERGTIVAEVETEKGLIDIETFHAGRVDRLLVEEGAEVPVGAPLAVIERPGEARSDGQPTSPSGPPSAPVRSTPSARRLARREGVDLRGVRPTGAHETVTRPDVMAARPPRVRISPAARRRAEALGVDPSSLRPGPDGAVHLAQVVAVDAPPAPPRSMRHAVGLAMSKSKREIPHYYLGHTVDLEVAMEWLRDRNERVGLRERLVPGVVLLAAVIHALAKVPELNARWNGHEAPPLADVHLGVAIATRGGGLVAPAIRHAHELSLEQLMEKLTDLVERARRGSLRSSELSEPTLTVTSLGERGVESVFGVIHPPQVAMVGIGKILRRPWVVDDAVVPRATVTLTLSADHRVSDGHRGGLYLAEIERLLQQPEAL